ncbi:cohesin subunit SA-2 isoform X1 [Drosophila takahashii]|uniref:cohesin subunit SA-2 isoform X1 n=1 Tax=Drosophila takahashii TaxID=29030 RepID=UPI001CF8D38A|nr:cohesin subunit SA-2 [Drosophila takahashii]
MSGSCSEIDSTASPAEEQASSSQNDENPEEQTPVKTLLQCVLSKNQKLDALASRWVKFYEESPTAALVTLMQFLLEASGSQYQIPGDTTRPFSYGEILQRSSLHFRNVTLYPIIMKTAEFFVHRVAGFFEALLKAANDLATDSYNTFLAEITGFLMACAESNVRPFRHTNTMIGLKIMTFLVQLKSVNDEELKQLWMRMFQGLFMECHRDVVDNIRLLCISELGVWFGNYPECHLDANSLRFLFEALDDSSMEVKLCSLTKILIICRHEDLRPMCLTLGNEFRELLLNLCGDKEDEISEESLRLLTELHRSSNEILSDDECEVLEELMFTAHRGLAQAAAELFIQRRREQMEGASFPQKMRHLLQFFIEKCQQEHAAYLVDSLFNKCEIICDWESMIEMLMEDQSPVLTEDESSALIEILCKGVAQGITREIPPGRYTKNLEIRPRLDVQDRATKLLAPVLPQLLRKYANRSEDLVNLLQIPRYFFSHYYSHPANFGQLSELMEQIDVLMFHQTNDRVLRTGAGTLRLLYELQSTHLLIETMLNSAVTNYKIALRTWQEMYGVSPSSSSSSSSGSSKSPRSRSRRLLNTLRLISALYAYFDLSSWQLTESVLSSLKRVTRERDAAAAGGRDSLPAEAVSLYLAVGFFSLNWDLMTFKEEALINEAGNMEDSCAALKKHLEDFLFVTFDQVVNGNDVSLSFRCFSYICDLFMIYDHQMLDGTNALLRSAAYEPSVNEVEILESFLLRHLLLLSPSDLMQDAHYDQLQNSRRILVSYCKLVAFNVIPAMRACKIFQYYEKYYLPYGDIMRSSMEQALRINPVHYGMTIFHTCLQLYQKIMNDNNDDGPRAFGSPEFSELMNLAKRLGETLISNRIQNRESVITLHRAGIMYVLESLPNEPTAAPKNLLFLSVLQAFVPQLLGQDKNGILELLQKIEQPDLPSCNREEWQPLEGYRSVLEKGTQPLRELNI